MINLLAIETSGDICSVGLSLDGNRFLKSEHVERRHNERLLPMLSALRDEAGFSQPALLEVLGGVAFGRGPGSFTGVRIAAAAAQAIALAAGVQVVRVASSETLARAALIEHPAHAGVVTTIRSRRNLHYVAAYENRNGQPQQNMADALCEASPAPAFYERYAGWLVAGSEPEWWQGPGPVTVRADAGALLDVAQLKWALGEQVDAAGGMPEYLPLDSPWRKSTG